MTCGASATATSATTSIPVGCYFVSQIRRRTYPPEVLSVGIRWDRIFRVDLPDQGSETGSLRNAIRAPNAEHLWIIIMAIGKRMGTHCAKRVKVSPNPRGHLHCCIPAKALGPNSSAARLPRDSAHWVRSACPVLYN
jgi:hypothetical protein